MKKSLSLLGPIKQFEPDLALSLVSVTFTVQSLFE